MDIRDVKESPDSVENGKYLEKIFELQKVLIDHYVSIEGLPPYPINVNTKPSQVILKDFIGRVVEELAEGFESAILVDELTNDNQLWFNEDGSSPVYKRMISHLQNMNEEQADAMHFMVELLIYCNILPEDIKSYIYKLSKENGFTHYPESERDEITDIIHEAMGLSILMYMEEETNDIAWRAKVDLLKELSGNEDPLNLVGHHLWCEATSQVTSKVLWLITYKLNIARNCLKNKPWKQSGVMTDESLFQQNIVEAFIAMMGYYSLLGMKSENVYHLYFKKNKVNQFRIKSNY